MAGIFAGVWHGPVGGGLSRWVAVRDDGTGDGWRRLRRPRRSL